MVQIAIGDLFKPVQVLLDLLAAPGKAQHSSGSLQNGGRPARGRLMATRICAA